jgi:hypothetical protein
MSKEYTKGYNDGYTAGLGYNVKWLKQHAQEVNYAIFRAEETLRIVREDRESIEADNIALEQKLRT